MLKRQRPATPPPSSLDDYPFSDSLKRPPYTVDPPQPRSKRQRTRPPPLDGALRGWLVSGPHGESDGEEDWTEDPGDVITSPLPPSTPDQYKDTNSLLHELHVLNQHRLLFVPHRDRSPEATRHSDTQYSRAQNIRTNVASHHSASLQSTHKGLVEEVECVRQRYEDGNRLLGSLFLSRRREVEGSLADT